VLHLIAVAIVADVTRLVNYLFGLLDNYLFGVLTETLRHKLSGRHDASKRENAAPDRRLSGLGAVGRHSL
jgi:hypothetical protein